MVASLLACIQSLGEFRLNLPIIDFPSVVHGVIQFGAITRQGCQSAFECRTSCYTRTWWRHSAIFAGRRSWTSLPSPLCPDLPVVLPIQGLCYMHLVQCPFSYVWEFSFQSERRLVLNHLRCRTTVPSFAHEGCMSLLLMKAVKRRIQKRTRPLRPEFLCFPVQWSTPKWNMLTWKEQVWVLVALQQHLPNVVSFRYQYGGHIAVSFNQNVSTGNRHDCRLLFSPSSHPCRVSHQTDLIRARPPFWLCGKRGPDQRQLTCLDHNLVRSSDALYLNGLLFSAVEDTSSIRPGPDRGHVARRRAHQLAEPRIEESVRRWSSMPV